MSGQLPSWLADWLGVDVPPGGDAATWRLVSAWNWAPWATLLLVLLAIAWTVVLYAREQTAAGRRYRGLLVALRLLAIGTLLVMLAQWALAVRLTGPPTIALVIDRSASMGIADRYDDPELVARLDAQLKASGLTDATRLGLAKLLATQDDGRLLAELSHRYRLDVFLIADEFERLPRAANTAELLRAVRALSADGADSRATRLGDAVRHVLADYRGTPPAAIILLTDGVTTAGAPLGDAAEDARRKGVPLVVVGLGSDRPPRDVQLADVLVDDVVFTGDPINFQIQITAAGLEGQQAQVILRRENEEAKGDSPLFPVDVGTQDDAEGREKGTVPRMVAEQTVTLPAGGDTLTVQLVDRPTTAGDVAYIVEVTPRDDETNPNNNRQRRLVAVRDARIRVLLASGYPSYEFRFLKTLLERDSTVELATFLQDADPDYAEQDRTALRSFPVSQDDLFGYDVLIVGDVDPRLLPRSVWQHVQSFVVEKGGGVLFVAGPRYLPWLYADNPDVTALLPATVADSPRAGAIGGAFIVRPTPLGLLSPPLQLGETATETEQIWRQLAPLYWRAEVGALKPAALVLADAGLPLREQANQSTPIIIFQYVGAGRVLFHAVDSTWRWRKGVGDAYFARYWVQAIRYLARGKLMGGRGAQLATDRREYRAGEAVHVRARFLDPRLAPTADAVTVAMEAAGRARQQIVLRRNPAAEGVFEGRLADLAEGSYQLLLVDPQVPGESPSAQFAVVAPPGELARPAMDRNALTAAAEATHGKFYTIADTERLLTELPAGRRVPVQNLPPVSLWNRWWLLALFLTCLTCEWIFRKRKGML